MSRSERPEAGHELVDRAVAASVELRLSLLPAGTDYVTMNPAERALDGNERAKARDWLERLSEQWREAEDVWFTELGEDFLPEGAILLLEALLDSLAIALLAEGEPKATLLTIEEVLDRVDELGREGKFPGLDPPMGSRSGRREGREEPRKRRQGERELVERCEELGDLALEALVSTFTFYLELAPDGRELDDGEATAVRERLLAGARAGRTLDAERDLLAWAAEPGGYDLRPTLAALRMLQHSLMLALSEDPERRARAMPVPQVQEHLRPVYEQWQEVRGGK